MLPAPAAAETIDARYAKYDICGRFEKFHIIPHSGRR